MDEIDRDDDSPPETSNHSLTFGPGSPSFGMVTESTRLDLDVPSPQAVRLFLLLSAISGVTWPNTENVQKHKWRAILIKQIMRYFGKRQRVEQIFNNFLNFLNFVVLKDDKDVFQKFTSPKF
jgi:hypothetical protein